MYFNTLKFPKVGVVVNQPVSAIHIWILRLKKNAESCRPDMFHLKCAFAVG